MALPVPNLDDRRFQDLVDDAKRLLQQRCPEWTDHNVSDPGVTLIELFAWMTEQLVYRLNRVPDRNYVKFLELIGVRLYPPTAARADVTFWLSAPQTEMVRVPAGTHVATVRTETEDAVSFTTTDDLLVVPTSLEWLATNAGDGQVRNQTETLQRGTGFLCFGQPPRPGDALLVGLADAVPSCAVALRFDCEIEGVGVDPRNPPLEWEAWDGDAWRACEVERDETGGLNRPGDVVLHVPRGHATLSIANMRAGWVRCRAVEAAEGQPQYSASPKINQVSAFTVGGTTSAVNADIVDAEILGVSDAAPGQRFEVRRRPVVPAESAVVLEVSDGSGWQEWDEVPNFSHSGPGDSHFVLDRVAGEVALGPAVRRADGSLHRCGAVPEKGATLRLRSYRTGGGRRGNVAAGALTVMKSSMPYVSRVENRRPAQGGVDGEDIENAKLRGPLTLHARNRAVTADDYEELAREVAPEVAVVRCVEAQAAADAGGVRVYVVPVVADEPARIRFEQLIPREETLGKIRDHLDAHRVIGARVMVETAKYRGVTVMARLQARRNANVARLQDAALQALYRYFRPVGGGPDGRGWPFGRPVHIGEVYSVLQAVPGVEFVDDARLYIVNPITGETAQEPVRRVPLDADSLVFSYDHQVVVEGG